MCESRLPVRNLKLHGAVLRPLRRTATRFRHYHELVASGSASQACRTVNMVARLARSPVPALAMSPGDRAIIPLYRFTVICRLSFPTELAE